jgi:DNA-binding transcriptional LysR family regulator
MSRLEAMETFIRVLESGSFSAAARQLRIGQPAISKSVAQLEERLGVRLLMRSARGLAATEAGQHFYEHARGVVERAEEAERAARGAGAGLEGRLRVSAGSTFASLHIVPRLPAFLDLHPKLAVDLVLHDGEINLVEEAIDIAVRMGPLRDSSLTMHRIAAGRCLVVGAPAYLERTGIPETPEQLTQHAMVIYIQRLGGEAWSFRQGSSERSINLPSRLRVSTAEGVRAAVMSGIGLAIASEWMFAPELASGAVRPVLEDWSLPSIDLLAVFPTRHLVSGKARAFSDFMKAELGQPRDGGEPKLRVAPGSMQISSTEAAFGPAALRRDVAPWQVTEHTPRGALPDTVIACTRSCLAVSHSSAASRRQ